MSRGCLYMECVYFLQPPHAVVLFDGNDCAARPIEALKPVALSLVERLGAWLADAACNWDTSENRFD